ncbi:nascent polypeptide-associated complex protein [Candidatus Micrarchaeota archaeon]|nr:nascent polypeptide-associated complex protein [Candidatus Micrarchaeota archaeon]
MHGMNPKQMAQLMRQMGIQTKEINADRVVIESNDKKIIIENPSVTEINMKGQITYQIIGNPRIEESINEDDVKLVMEQANVSREVAENALKETNGDIAEAITKLQDNTE